MQKYVLYAYETKSKYNSMSSTKYPYPFVKVFQKILSRNDYSLSLRLCAVWLAERLIKGV